MLSYGGGVWRREYIDVASYLWQVTTIISLKDLFGRVRERYREKEKHTHKEKED